MRLSPAVLEVLVAVAPTWKVALGGRLLTVRVVLATPATVVGATGDKAAAPEGLTLKVVTVPLGAVLPLTTTLAASGSEVSLAVEAAELAHLREAFALSFGCCSLEDPIRDLRSMMLI